MRKLVQTVVLSGVLVAGASHAQEASDGLHSVNVGSSTASKTIGQQDREKPEYVLYSANQYWTNHRVDWYYNPSNQPSYISTAAFLNAFQLAADRWSAMCNVSFNYMGTTTASPLINGVSSQVDRQNVLGWGPIAQYYYQNSLWSSGSSIVDADILIDNTTNWNVESLDGELTQALGHMIGFQYSLDRNSIMYLVNSTSTQYKQTLHGDDAAGCAALYGEAPTAASNRLFNWAEATYPTFLASGPAHSDTLQGYYYRYYAGSKSYVATKDGSAFYMGPNGQIQNLGTVSSFDAQVHAAGF